MPKKYLLAIDGGGVRGIIPAMALVKLEATCGKLTREIFSFVAGTSTGAVMAAAIAAGIPATQIRDLYLNRSREIFTRYPWNIFKRILTGSMYSSQKLHHLIKREVGSAGDWILNDSPVDLLITAKRIPDGRPWYFVRDNPRNAGCTGRVGLVDCVTASAAAPTYFAPWTILEKARPPGCEDIGTLVDGGVGVTGNPVYQACVEAFHFTDFYTPSDTVTVSLGTGRFTSRRRPGWIGSWLEWVLDELLESPEEQQTEITARHFPEMVFYRLDLELRQQISLDDVNRLNELKSYGEQLAEKIDWEAILTGREETFRVRNGRAG